MILELYDEYSSSTCVYNTHIQIAIDIVFVHVYACVYVWGC